MDEQREQFEAWLLRRQGPTGDTPGYPGSVPFYHDQEAAAWEGWQAATQRQQERITELEADVAHKDAYAEQLGRELFKAYAERQELEAQVQALSLDAGRLDWIAMHGGFGVDSVTGLPGGNGQKRKAATRAAIDAAIAAGKGGA